MGTQKNIYNIDYHRHVWSNGITKRMICKNDLANSKLSLFIFWGILDESSDWCGLLNIILFSSFIKYIFDFYVC